MSWQDKCVLMMQNHLHRPDAAVDGTVSSPIFGNGYELENTMNLIPSRPGRFATAADARYSSGGGAGSAKVIRYTLPRSLSCNAVALINVKSNVLDTIASGEYGYQKTVALELFYGTSGTYGTQIGTVVTMSADSNRRWGNNIFYWFTNQSSNVFTLRLSHYDNSQVNAMEVGNVLLGRIMGLPGSGTVGSYTSGPGWFSMVPAARRITSSMMLAGRAYGSTQMESRMKPLRRFEVACKFNDEAYRENFEWLIGDRDGYRMDGLQNQLVRQRLDMPTIIVPPWQWTGTGTNYAHPVFGMIDMQRGVETAHDTMGRSIVRFEFQELG